MIRYIVIAAVAVVAAAGAAQGVVSLDNARHHQNRAASLTGAPTPVPQVVAEPRTPEQPQPQTASIAKSADGHYWAEAKVNGSRVRFLVDTGATAVALSPRDAARLGYPPSSLVYGHKVMTANGEARAARVQLESVSVAGARVNDVDAYVIEKGLDTSLLGMTYLGRLEKFEATKTALILRP